MPVVGWEPARLTAVLARLRAGARVGGAPAALRAAAVVLRDGLPGTAAGLGRRLQTAGVTEGVLHPVAVVRLAELWDVPAPPVVALRWPSQGQPPDAARVLWGARGTPDPTPPVAVAVHAAGALDCPAWPAEADQAQRLDLLTAAGLHAAGPQVVWDRAAAG